MDNKTVGIVFIIIGVALIFWGYSVYDSVASQIGRTLSGDTPIEAWAGMIGGIICVVIGIRKVK